MSGKISFLLGEGLENFFFKEPDSKYLGFAGQGEKLKL
jgi:hypothetical protein